MDIQFYDVKTRSKVKKSGGDIKKTSYTRETKAGKTQTRYAVMAEHDGRRLVKFVSKADWDKIKAPVV